MPDNDTLVSETSIPSPTNDFVNSATATGAYVLNEGDTPKSISQSDSEIVHSIKVPFSKKANKTNIEIGDLVTYTLTVTNNSSVDFTKVVFFDNVPTNLEIESSTPTGITKALLISGYDAGPLAKGKSISIQYIAEVKSCSGLTNTAHATVYFKGSCSSILSVTTESKSWTLTCKAPTLFVAKSVDKCYVTGNDSTRMYTVHVKNTGDIPITDFDFKDDLAGGSGTYLPTSTYYSLNSVDESSNPYNHDPSKNEVVVPDLAPGDDFKIQYSVTYSL